jgi:DeoR/GlpR family transcriptional regulator of sugar metabolism
VTNSTRAFGILNSLPGRRTAILVGGQRAAWDAMVGPIAEQTIATMHFDALITGAFGITSAGVTTRDLAESSTIRRFVEQADHVIVLASAEKWGRHGLAAIATLDEVALFVTDRKTEQATAFGTDFANRLVCTTGALTSL